MTQIFDNPADFADEALDGFVAANRGYVARVDGGVVRSTEVPAGQVALVVGGGSGHYPAFAGLVGPGLAAGSACGNMFASPAAGQVYRVAKAADAGGGVLLSYGNYAGDVLHFGQAQLRLNAEGIETRTVLVTDDIACAPLAEIGEAPRHRRGPDGLQDRRRRRRGRTGPGRRRTPRHPDQLPHPLPRRGVRRLHPARRGRAAVHRPGGPDVPGPGHPRRTRHLRSPDADRLRTRRTPGQPSSWPTSPRTPGPGWSRSSTASARSSTTNCSCCSARSKSSSPPPG